MIYPPKPIENQSYEDVFPIENGGFSNVILVFRGVLWPGHETAKKEMPRISSLASSVAKPSRVGKSQLQEPEVT